jgi:hypothetical protein
MGMTRNGVSFHSLRRRSIAPSNLLIWGLVSILLTRDGLQVGPVNSKARHGQFDSNSSALFNAAEAVSTQIPLEGNTLINRDAIDFPV